MQSLSPRKQAFVTAWIRTGNAKQSAIEAGYSAKSAGNTGWRLLKKDEAVIAAVKENQLALRESEEIDLKQQIRRFERLRNDAELAKQYQAAVKAEENIARMMGFLNDKAQVNLNGQFAINIGGIEPPRVIDAD